MNDWKEILLGEVIEVVNGFAFKSTNFLESRIDNSLPVIKIKNVANGDVHLNGCQFHYYNNTLDKFVIDYGDVLIALTGNHPEVRTQVVGVASRYKKCEKAFLNQRVAKVSPKDWKKLSNDFLYYFLKDENTHDYLASQSTGSANQANISKGDIESIPLNLPQLPEQTAIAEVLSSLDDKIDLLHRQNKTLEQLAETLFRQWFVEESDEGWEEATIRDIADHVKEIINPSKSPDTIYHHFSLPAFDDGKVPKAEIGKEILSNKYKVVANSILISKLNPRFPRIWELYGDSVPENAICSTEFQIIKPKDIKMFGFIYCFLKSTQVTQELANAAGGTSGSHQRINPDDIFNLAFQVPRNNLIEKFDLITKEHFQKIKYNSQQIQTLTKLRETLLPKLMSGEVRLNQ